MSREIKWTDAAVKKSGYYYYSGHKRTTVGIIWFDKGQKMLDEDMRSHSVINLPAPPKAA